ncbi:hypothetical protein HanIR_Chr06g0297881 [Helianthus annuus]|nr:hypothetical protein HanIR_Chr06g0297881 [Helianthus annuus]
MHILKVPSFFFTKGTGAPQGEEIGRINPLSKISCSCVDSSSDSVGAKQYGARAMGAAPGASSI